VCFKRFTFCSKTFFGAEGLENVINLSDFNSGIFGKTNGLEILDGPLALKSIIVVDTDGTIIPQRSS
jgi:thiol peroxidase